MAEDEGTMETKSDASTGKKRKMSDKGNHEIEERQEREKQ